MHKSWASRLSACRSGKSSVKPLPSAFEIMQDDETQWFKMVRSIWLPTNEALVITAVVAATAATAALNAIEGLNVSMHAAIAFSIAWAMQYMLLWLLRVMEEHTLNMTADVRQDRSAIFLGTFSIPGAAIFSAVWLALCGLRVLQLGEAQPLLPSTEATRSSSRLVDSSSDWRRFAPTTEEEEALASPGCDFPTVELAAPELHKLFAEGSLPMRYDGDHIAPSTPLLVRRKDATLGSHSNADLRSRTGWAFLLADDAHAAVPVGVDFPGEDHPPTRHWEPLALRQYIAEHVVTTHDEAQTGWTHHSLLQEALRQGVLLLAPCLPAAPCSDKASARSPRGTRVWIGAQLDA